MGRDERFELLSPPGSIGWSDTRMAMAARRSFHANVISMSGIFNV
jgi:hypothetical protein